MKVWIVSKVATHDNHSGLSATPKTVTMLVTVMLSFKNKKINK
jgi:hypothetical protein